MPVIPLIQRDFSTAAKTTGSALHAGAAIGGLSVGVILCIALLIFVVAWYLLYRNAKKKHLETGKPINHAKIIGMAALCAIGIGLVMLCLSDCLDGGENNASSGEDAQAQAPTMQQNTMGAVAVPPMTYQNPFAGPVSTAANDPVLG